VPGVPDEIDLVGGKINAPHPVVGKGNPGQVLAHQGLKVTYPSKGNRVLAPAEVGKRAVVDPGVGRKDFCRVFGKFYLGEEKIVGNAFLVGLERFG